MNRRNVLCSISLLILPSLSSASGFGAWHFGMSRLDVKAKSDFGPYYDFRNNDVGTRNGLVDGTRLPISFYFQNDRLVRIRILFYQEKNFDEAGDAWLVAFKHVEKHFGGAELPSLKKGNATDFEASVVFLNSGLRDSKNVQVQFGATPMPLDRRVWCTASRLPAGDFMVALNYAEV
jgi:hypothetical protein